jgi:hypothetical protein
VVVDLVPGLFGPGFGEKAFCLGQPELRPTFSRALLIQQSCGPLSRCPQVDDFRHVNGQR